MAGLVAFALLGLALGGVTAVGLAWQIARQAPEFEASQAPPRWSHPTGPAWLHQKQESKGAIRLRGQFASAAATGNRRAVTVDPPPPWSELSQPSLNVTGATTKWEEAFGWPVPAMMSRIDQTPGGGVHVVSGIHIKPRQQAWGQVVYLPTKPIWSGVVIGALVFAPAWWVILLLLLLSLRMLRHVPRVLRRRRGRCPQCGYDLRGRLDDGCSECGWRRAMDC